MKALCVCGGGGYVDICFHCMLENLFPLENIQTAQRNTIYNEMCLRILPEQTYLEMFLCLFNMFQTCNKKLCTDLFMFSHTLDVSIRACKPARKGIIVTIITAGLEEKNISAMFV